MIFMDGYRNKCKAQRGLDTATPLDIAMIERLVNKEIEKVENG